MKKPETSKKRKIAAAKRGLKRSDRFKASRKTVAVRRKKMQDAKKMHDKKMAELMDKILQSRFQK